MINTWCDGMLIFLAQETQTIIKNIHQVKSVILIYINYFIPAVFLFEGENLQRRLWEFPASCLQESLERSLEDAESLCYSASEEQMRSSKRSSSSPDDALTGPVARDLCQGALGHGRG